MKLKTLILLLLLGATCYLFYGYVTTHFSQPALAYKSYVSALIEGDRSQARGDIVNDEALRAFDTHAERMQHLGGTPRLIWYEFISRKESPDGKTVQLVVLCHVRVDPEGEDTYWGKEDRRDRHYVTLMKVNSAWKVASFEDSSTLSGESARAMKRR
ncbi:hypothetical protein H5P28_08195 [Ruficoccus amylovorans]|uniref:Uncharacterized protein n=1 Tax=Ruficoccus amylovorans TaxID=1804625 RepID=A0A842HG62_9BACT|nr:hypothetical protein [Ruficoccus amylovorans]MBC2594241.1 hypothetical protein [Ruficoccus amylovorans]